MNPRTARHIPAALVTDMEATNPTELLLSDEMGTAFKKSIDSEGPNIILQFHSNWLSTHEP